MKRYDSKGAQVMSGGSRTVSTPKISKGRGRIRDQGINEEPLVGRQVDRSKNIISYSGKGLSDILLAPARAILVDKSINQLMPGESHGILKLPDGRYANAQYMGPGTNVLARVKRRDKGLTNVDIASKAHDIRYSLAKSNADIDRADDIMLNAINTKPDDPFNKLQARLIWPKRQLARIGIRLGSSFGDPRLDKDPAMQNLYKYTLNGLASRGFGKGKQAKKSSRSKSIKKKPAARGRGNILKDDFSDHYLLPH